MGLSNLWYEVVEVACAEIFTGKMTDSVAFSFILSQRNISHCGKTLGNSKKLDSLSCSQEFADKFQRE